MNISILDDVHHVFGTLPSYAKLAGHQVMIWHDHTEDVDVLAERLQGAEVLALHRDRTPITAALVGRLPKLKLISMRGPYPHIDVAACTRHGILISSHQLDPQADPSWSTAELTLTLLLMSLRELPQQIESMKVGRWQSGVGRGVYGRTLGIYAYGRIGSTVARYGRTLGMQVQVWGRGASLERARADGYAVAASRQAFFSECDAISLHLPMIAATRGVVTEADLLLMKPTAVIINTSRAGLIAPNALVNALKAGRPGKAAVDVYEKEPLTDANHPLLSMPNVICTPHIGGVELDALEVMFSDVYEQIVAYAAGKPIDVMNPEALKA